MRIKKDVRTITQSEEQEKLLSDLLGRVFKIDIKICSKKCLFSVLLCY